MNGGNLQATLFLLNRPEPIRQSALLMVLTTGIGDAATLIAGLKALAAESRPPWSNRIHHLRVQLEQGQSLSEALTIVSGLLPEETAIAIRIGEQTGSLKQVLAEEAHRLMKIDDYKSPIQATFQSTFAWTLAIGGVASFLVWFIMFFIIPKFKRIFENFGVELPDLTKRLISISDWVFQYWYLALLPAITVVGFGAFHLIYWRIQSLSNGRTVLAEYFPRYWSPLILRLLSITIATGQSVSESLHSILRELRPGLVATRLSAVRMRMNAGDDCWESLQKEGFLKSREVVFLQSSKRTHHLDWGLNHLARAIERGRRKWVQTLTSFIQPLVVLCVGLVVGFICIGLFLPLIQLMDDLSRGAIR